MFPPKKILFPVDCSVRCAAAARVVEAFTRRFHADLTVLLVIEPPTMGYYYPFDKVIPAKDVLVSFVADQFKDLDVMQLLLTGDPAGEIVQYADHSGFDLIMLPTHGYGPFRRFLLGSVTAKVLHDTPCPVWTAAHTEDSQSLGPVDYRNIMCAVDVAPESVDLIRYAARLADFFKARLRLVHAVTAAQGSPEMYLNTDFREFVLEANRAEIQKLQQQAGMDLELCLEGGTVSTVVRDAALYHDADLVVIGRGKLQEHLGRLRTHSYAIIRNSPCPVLSV